MGVTCCPNRVPGYILKQGDQNHIKKAKFRIMTWNSITGIYPQLCIVCIQMFWFFGTYREFKDNPTLSFWWLFNRIQAKLVIRYQLSVIGYQLLQQNCTCFYLLLSVLLIIIILYFLTPVIIITPHYNYSATYHDLMVIWQINLGTLLTNRFIIFLFCRAWPFKDL